MAQAQAANLGQSTYRRRWPEESVLYRLVRENLNTFLELVREETGHPLPEFVEEEFTEYLKCGILAHGFMRVQCTGCRRENLIAFSCKKRGFCPSCGGRRMSETAIHLVDRVLPERQVRQWVLSFPYELRLLLAIRPQLMQHALRITHECIAAHLRKKVGLRKHSAASGAVTLIQRFGGQINLNVHFHQLFIDGVYELGQSREPLTFHEAPAPTVCELDSVLGKIIARFTRLLERQGIIVKDDETLCLGVDDDDSLAKLQAGAVGYRFAMGPNKGKKALTLRTVGERDHESRRGLVAASSGFSLHAGVAIAGGERVKLEKLCRYIARPAVSEERLSMNGRGQVVYRLKRAFDDGTTHIIMEPLELMERLAAIIPRPRVHLTRFHGVLAPHYRYRKQIVPTPLAPSAAEPASVETSGPVNLQIKKARISWSKLLARVFGIDVETCAECGGKTKILAAIVDPPVVRKILDSLGLPSKPPLIPPARGPPVAADFDDLNQDIYPLDFA